VVLMFDKLRNAFSSVAKNLSEKELKDLLGYIKGLARGK